MELKFNNSLTGKSDEDLVNLFRKRKDSRIISIFYERYAHLVLGVCLKYLKNKTLAEDITMQVYEKLLNKLHLYEIANFKSWLFSVTKNECMMLLRKKNVTEPLNEEMHKINGSFVEFHEEMHLSGNADELKTQQLNSAVEKLNEEQRLCIVLFYFNKNSYKEIEERTGYSQKQIKSFIQNGKRNLKNILLKNA